MVNYNSIYGVKREYSRKRGIAMKNLIRISLIASMFMLLAFPVYAQSPIKSLKKTNAKINKLLRQKVKTGTPAEKKNKESITKAVNAFLDFAELAKQSLGKHWEKRTKEQQTEFVKILQELIEKNYIKQLRSNMDYKLEYRKQTQKKDKAKVVTAVKVVKNGRTTEIIIEYKTLKAAKGWMVYDVVTDDVSLIRNYRSQFNRIIRRNSYESLVKKMRRKLKKSS